MQISARKIAVGLAAAATVLATVGGAWWWHQRSAEPARPVAAIDSKAPFLALDCAPRLFDDRPALAVMFSQPVDRKQKLDELIRVTDLGVVTTHPGKGGKAEKAKASATKSSATSAASSEPSEAKIVEGSWVVGDNARVVYFSAVTAQHNYRIEVNDTVMSQDGIKIKEEKSCDVTSEQTPPAYYFASRGVVLPAGQNGGLPIVTMNVPEVDVQFLRVNADAMPRFFERVAGVRHSKPSSRQIENTESGEYDSEEDYNYEYGRSKLKGSVGGWELEQLRQSSRSVYLGRYLTSDQTNARHVTYLPVETIKELLEPGVYVAVMSQPGRFASEYQVTYFYVSDIGVQVHRYSQTLDAFASSLKSGSALRGVNFELLDENARSLGKADADGDGHVHFDVVPAKASLLVARRGDATKGDMSVIVLREPGLDLSEFDVGGHPSGKVKLFAYSGRDLYRPGERFELSVLMRNPDGKPLGAGISQPITATLKRPDGRTVSTSSWKANDKIPGYMQHTVNIPADGQTGAWYLELRADPGAKKPDASWRFQVEEFLPERMKLALSTGKAVLLQSDEFGVKVRGEYLFGAPAAGNRLMVAAVTERARHALPQAWPGFIFGDFADDNKKKRIEVSDESLDDKGDAEVVLPIDLAQVHSPMLVRGSFSLLESGGRPVVRSIERVVWPAPQLIAVRPLFDRDVASENGKADFEVVRVDSSGKPHALAKAAVRLIREDREYYWRYDDQRGWHSGYSEAEEEVYNGTVDLKTERAKLSVPVAWGRHRIEIDDAQTGQTLRYRFYAGWGSQAMEEMGNRPDRVQIKLANAPFKAGEKAQITITPPHDGVAVVTLEGDSLLWSERVDVKASGTQISVPIDEKWARHDLYVAVTVLRPGSQGDRVTPARAVGLVHLPLARENRQLKVALQAPTKVLPEKRTTVKVKVDGLADQTGYVTISAVDVGILNITRYQSPDAFDFFFGKHRYAVELLDMYGKLIEKMDGTTGKLKFGGDAKMRDSKSMPKKVKLIDLFSGPVALNAKGEAEVPLDIPDFNGTLRLMAVAATADRFGKAEQEMTSAAPIVAELAMPRFIAPGDNATIALDVTNLSGAAQDIKISLQGTDPVRVIGPEKTLQLKNQQRSTLRFGVEATDAYGLGRLRLQLTSASGVKIVREAALQVQPAVSLEREVKRSILEAGASMTLAPSLIDKYFKGSANVSVTLSNRPPLNVNRLVQGLLDYPYGCLEQTTSAAYPHLFIDEAAAKTYGLQPRSLDQRKQFVEGAIGRLAGMQKSNGGYTLWGDGSYEVYLSAYVQGFLQDARGQGFTVPEGMYKNGQDWLLLQLQQAPNRFPVLPKATQADAASKPVAVFNERDYALVRDSHQRFAEMAHVGYMLARDQKAPLATLRYLHDQVRDRARSPLPLVHLGLALKLMGDEKRAQEALADAMKRHYGIESKRFAYGWEWLGDYGSNARDLAMSYALLARHGVKIEGRENLLANLVNVLGPRYYYSTQERLAMYLAARAAGGETNAEWTALLKQGDIPLALASKSTEMRSFDASILSKGVTLTNPGKSSIFVELEGSGYPVKAPVPRNDVIELRRDWYEANGSPLGNRALKVGDVLIVRVQARAHLRMEDAMIVDRVPAGFEIENFNISQGVKADEMKIGDLNVAQALADDRIKHREYRDDRYVAAARLDQQPLNVLYMVRVVSPGTFVVPAPFAEDMYRPELRGVGVTGPNIVVTDPRGSSGS